MAGNTRKGSPPIKVWLLPEEKEGIEENARRVGLSASAYLRNIGLGLTVRGVLDQRAVIELSKINGDLGRLGGLLKMWLSSDERLAVFKQDQVHESIVDALVKIRLIQGRMLERVEMLCAIQ